MDTAKLYVELYPWHPMTPTLHKVLLHGHLIIKHALLPIGHLTEEAAEARNTHFRNCSLNYALKFSRLQCNTDIIIRLLLTSDPLLSSIRKPVLKKRAVFSKEALEMFHEPTFLDENHPDDDSKAETETHLESDYSIEASDSDAAD
ncbi:hypothetical protein HUJ05_008743 [Dendroctonus ponderosae]|nr:hypothetical protein HUJ05_008743 [Dendroctonus ponderosae]